jgi:hypothetical protein
MSERHAVSEAAQPLAGPLERLWIAVDPDQANFPVAFQQCFRVPSQSERRVDEYAVGTIGLESLEYLL